eukprot:m.261742 g.261742  ORF g.261742 m.261742 type:complete len:147 (-) comp43015_c0_seq1:452-892(-)
MDPTLLQQLHIDDTNTDDQNKKHPVKSHQISCSLDGIRTEFVFNWFTNYLFVIVSQFDKIGSLLLATQGEHRSAMPTYTIKQLLGSTENVLLDVCARQIAEHLAGSTSSPLPLLLGISLKTDTPRMVRAVVDTVKEQITAARAQSA